MMTAGIGIAAGVITTKIGRGIEWRSASSTKTATNIAAIGKNHSGDLGCAKNAQRRACGIGPPVAAAAYQYWTLKSRQTGWKQKRPSPGPDGSMKEATKLAR
jgi:hypothetical protein